MKALPPEFIEIIAHWPKIAGHAFATMRETVYTVAARGDVGPLVETLKWGQPSWLPEKPRMGTTLRCNWSATQPDRLSLFVNCQTSLLETMRTIYPNAFTYDGNRALHIDLKSPLPIGAIDHCALLTLRYHRKTA